MANVESMIADEKLHRHVCEMLESIQAHRNTNISSNNTVQYEFVQKPWNSDPTIDFHVRITADSAGEYQFAVADVRKDGVCAFSSFVNAGQKALCPVFQH